MKTKKTKKLSRTEYLMFHAHALGLTPITGADLFAKQQQLLDISLTDEFKRAKHEILIKNGYDKASWNDVLTQSGHFWFCGDELMNKTNNEIKLLCKKFDVHNPMRELHYLYAVLKNCKSKHISREKNNNNIFVYKWTN